MPFIAYSKWILLLFFDLLIVLSLPPLILCVLKGELVTASKAIIEKEYQPKVIVSKQGPNPFTKLTDQELEEYRREVELKQKGGEGEEQSNMKSF